MQLRRITRGAVAITALAAAFALGTIAFHRSPSLAPATASASEPPASANPVRTTAPPDFTSIVRAYGPAVVNVSTVGTVKVAEQVSPFQIDPNDPFFQFFKRFSVPMPRSDEQRHGVGSGFIVSPDGVILTNAHVVNGASEVTVKLTDRREFAAKVVGMDKATDVAVLRIDAKNLPTVKLGDPSKVQVGEWVLAIGSPFGFENSASAGIVSARQRSLPDEGYVPFLQTDVAVNPGNSGGPLFDAAGEVIGINSQIYTNSGGYMGVSFAIPIDTAMKVEGQLLAHGKVTRARLGVMIQQVNQQLAESFGLPKPEGALVSSVEKGSPAAQAGIEPGDIILSLDGKEVANAFDLPPRVADLEPGARARLEVWRDHNRRDLTVTLAAAKDSAEASAAQGESAHERLGIVARSLTPDEKSQLGASGGVVVEQVEGPAARAGVQPGDVVLALNGSPVKDVAQLRELVAKAHKHVALLLERGEARIFVPVDLG